MGGETALRRQARGEKGKRGEAERPKGKKCARGEPGDEPDRGEIDEEREDARRSPTGKAIRRPVHDLLQPSQPTAHPSDGMADQAVERRRIAEKRLGDQRCERKGRRKRKRHDGESDMMAGLDWTVDDRAFTYHGGALEVARRLAPQAPRALNRSLQGRQCAYPLPDLEVEAWSRLPESGELAKLEAAALRHGVAPEAWSRAPARRRSSSAVSHIATRRGRRAGVDLWRFRGGVRGCARAVEAKRLEDMGALDVAIAVNPNNTDGRIIPRAALLDLHERLARRGGVLIVDEAFADFAPLALEFTQGPHRCEQPGTWATVLTGDVGDTIPCSFSCRLSLLLELWTLWTWRGLVHKSTACVWRLPQAPAATIGEVEDDRAKADVGGLGEGRREARRRAP